MRFNPFNAALLLLVTATYVTYLGLFNQLVLYIHPRYVLFTLAMAVICVALSVAHSTFTTKVHAEHGQPWSLIPLLFLLAVGIVVPARTLTSATVSQRTTDAGSLVATTNSKPINLLFAGSSRGLKLADWSRLLSTNTDPAYYANKPAKISGFIYDGGLGPDTVLLSRFVLTCCAVDAQPVGVPVRIKNWDTAYEKDQWLEVEGQFEAAQTASGEQLVLQPASVEEIKRPRNPYAN